MLGYDKNYQKNWLQSQYCHIEENLFNFIVFSSWILSLSLTLLTLVTNGLTTKLGQAAVTLRLYWYPTSMTDTPLPVIVWVFSGVTSTEAWIGWRIINAWILAIIDFYFKPVARSPTFRVSPGKILRWRVVALVWVTFTRDDAFVRLLPNYQNENSQN